MAFDFGRNKIGIAVGQTVTKTATPIAIIRARDGIPDWLEIEKLVKEWQPGLFVVGLPINMDDSPSEMSRLAEKFGRRLRGRFNIPYEMMDERLTSYEARSNESSDKPIDDVAAQLILESYFQDRGFTPKRPTRPGRTK
ncbi:MAG: Holliday junction resolvase RuvX [Gammaproteobacteria bacterium]|nr:Holliday junction resolvase RuvX [Gammaproteobacteria bacterium]